MRIKYLTLLLLPILIGCTQNEQVSKAPMLMVEIKDLTPPEIHLKKDMTITVGDSFDVRNYVTVNDNFDKKVSYTISGKVNTKKPGLYKLLVQSKDKAGNSSSAKMNVKEKKKVPVTGTNESNSSTIGHDQQQNEKKNDHVKDIQISSSHQLSGKKYLYSEGYNQITASAACNKDLVNNAGAGACIILFDNTGTDIGMMLK